MVIGVVPAAGHATRLGLRRGSKEMLQVGGRPIMDVLVERMRMARPDEIRIVTRPEKDDVVRHARPIGATVCLGQPSDVTASLRLGMEGLEDGDVVLLGFPDTLWQPADGFVRLVGALRDDVQVVLGLFSTADAARSDVVVSDGSRVTAIQVKPQEPAGNVIWGCAAARAGALRGCPEGTEPGEYFGDLARDGHVAGVWLSNDFLDIGTPESLRQVADDPPPELERSGDDPS